MITRFRFPCLPRHGTCTGFFCLLFLCVPWPAAATSGQAEDVAVAMPLRLVNLNPFFVPYGVPVSFGTRTLPPGSSELTVAVDTASYLSTAASGSERLLLDGEDLPHQSHVAPRVPVPLGIFPGIVCRRAPWRVVDGFIENWHDFFGLPQGDRDRTPRDRFASPTRTAPAPESICAGTSLRCLIWCSASGIPCRIGWLRMTVGNPEPP